MPTCLYGLASGFRRVISSFFGRTLKRLKGCALAWEYLSSLAMLSSDTPSLSCRNSIIAPISDGCAAIVPLIPSGARRSVPQMLGTFFSENAYISARNCGISLIGVKRYSAATLNSVLLMRGFITFFCVCCNNYDGSCISSSVFRFLINVL